MDITKELARFKLRLNSCALTESEKENYLVIERKILDSEQLPVSQLLERARRIKPLVRVQKGDLSARKKTSGEFSDTDLLCFCTPCDIRRRSYLYDFTPKKIVRCKGRPLQVPPREKVGEFTCYHNTGDFYGILMPSVDEVLQQIPSDIDWLEVDAFELTFPSLNFREVYDGVLDRHVSNVILYRFPHRLSSRLRGQDVIFEGKRY